MNDLFTFSEMRQILITVKIYQWIFDIRNLSYADFVNVCSSKILLHRDLSQIKTSFPLKPSLCGSGIDSCPTGKLLDFLALDVVLSCDR